MTDSPTPAPLASADEVRYLRAACHRLETALAKRCLADANATLERPNDWPGGQQWDELVGSSHSIFRHRAWEEAGLDLAFMRDLLFENGYPKPYAGDDAE